MKKLLHIECSPRKERSVSRKLAEKFIETYRLKHPHAPITTLDLWKTPLPDFDEYTVNAKFKVINGQDFTAAEKERWDHIRSLFEQFSTAEKYIFSVPMWNFSIPYKLKHYIDLITQPGLAFAVTPSGYRGLIVDRPVVLLLTRGGIYRNSPLASMDMQEKYLELWLRFIGFVDIRTVYAEGMMSDHRSDSIENAMEMAIAEAARF